MLEYKIIFFGKSKETGDFLNQWSQGRGLPFASVLSKEDLEGEVEGSNSSVVLFQGFGFTEQLDYYDSLKGDKKIIPLFSIEQALNAEAMLEILERKELNHFFGAVPDIDRVELIWCIRKIIHAKPMELGDYLSLGGSELDFLPVNDSNQKSEMIEQIASFAKEKGIKEKYINLLESVADEMIMNALYDAPRDVQGKEIYASASRTERVRLTEEQSAVLSYGYDGGKFGLFVKDPFGLMTREILFRYFEKCFRRGEDQIDEKQGGAGLGLYTMYENCSVFCLEILPEVYTEFMTTFHFDLSRKDFRNRIRSIHFFEGA